MSHVQRVRRVNQQPLAAEEATRALPLPVTSPEPQRREAPAGHVQTGWDSMGRPRYTPTNLLNPGASRPEAADQPSSTVTETSHQERQTVVKKVGEGTLGAAVALPLPQEDRPEVRPQTPAGHRLMWDSMGRPMHVPSELVNPSASRPEAADQPDQSDQTK